MTHELNNKSMVVSSEVVNINIFEASYMQVRTKFVWPTFKELIPSKLSLFNHLYISCSKC